MLCCVLYIDQKNEGGIEIINTSCSIVYLLIVLFLSFNIPRDY